MWCPYSKHRDKTVEELVFRRPGYVRGAMDIGGAENRWTVTEHIGRLDAAMKDREMALGCIGQGVEDEWAICQEVPSVLLVPWATGADSARRGYRPVRKYRFNSARLLCESCQREFEEEDELPGVGSISGPTAFLELTLSEGLSLPLDRDKKAFMQKLKNLGGLEKPVYRPAIIEFFHGAKAAERWAKEDRARRKRAKKWAQHSA